MAAVQYVSLMDYMTNLLYLMESQPETISTRTFLTGEMLLNPAWAFIPLDMDDKHDILRRLTGMTVALDPDMNCYPRGEAEVACFDLDGMPIP